MAQVVKEEWFEFPGTKAKLSSYGRLIVRGKERIPYVTAKGYLAWSCCYLPASHIQRNLGLVFKPNHDAGPTAVVDHIDRDRFNNTLTNLEWVPNAENIRNTGLRKNNTSGVTGVYKRPSGKYCAQICINRRTVVLGLFDTIQEAASARKLKQIEIKGYR